LDKKRREAWFSTTEVEELVDAIEHCAELALTARYDVTGWKWLILALHRATQGACACALRGNDATGTAMLTKQSAQAVRRWLGAQRRRTSPSPMPRQVLVSLAELYKRVADTDYLGEHHMLPVTGDMKLDIAKLAKLRNEFDSFRPGGYSLEVSGLPGVVRTCCHAIQHLAVDQSTFRRHLGGNHMRRIELALKALRKAMDEWEMRR
jgi:hypothetical protein